MAHIQILPLPVGLLLFFYVVANPPNYLLFVESDNPLVAVAEEEYYGVCKCYLVTFLNRTTILLIGMLC